MEAGLQRGRVLTAAVGTAIAFAAHAQQRPPVQTGPAAAPAAPLCALLSNADVARLTGRTPFGDPEPWGAGGGMGCTWGGGEAQVIVFDGARPQGRWEDLLKGFGHADARRHPVAAIGEGAYAVYTEPKTRHQDAAGFLVIPHPTRVVVVSVIRDAKQPIAQVESTLVAVAKAVMPKLR